MFYVFTLGSPHGGKVPDMDCGIDIYMLVAIIKKRLDLEQISTQFYRL